MTKLTPTDDDLDFKINGVAGGFKLVDDMSIIRSTECVNHKSALRPTVKPSMEKLFREEQFNSQISLQHV